MIHDNDFGGMDELAEESVQETNALLANREAEVLQRTSIKDLERFRPQIKDPASFEKLLAAVKASTEANENKAEFKNRLSKLGTGVINVAGKVAKLALKIV